VNVPEPVGTEETFKCLNFSSLMQKRSESPRNAAMEVYKGFDGKFWCFWWQRWMSMMESCSMKVKWGNEMLGCSYISWKIDFFLCNGVASHDEIAALIFAMRTLPYLYWFFPKVLTPIKVTHMMKLTLFIFFMEGESRRWNQAPIVEKVLELWWVAKVVATTFSFPEKYDIHDISLQFCARQKTNYANRIQSSIFYLL